MTIQTNNETIKSLLHSNALTRNYLKEFEYELLVTIDNTEDFTLNYLCPFCDKLHAETIKGIKLTDNKFIVCTHPLVLMDAPILVLGFVLNHSNNTFEYLAMMERIQSKIIPLLELEDMHENTMYTKIKNMYDESSLPEFNTSYNSNVHLN